MPTGLSNKANETLIGNGLASESSVTCSQTTIKNFRLASDKTASADTTDGADYRYIVTHGLSAVVLDSDQYIQSVADADTYPDHNLYGKVISVSPSFSETAEKFEIPISGTVQINGEVWLRYDSDTDKPTIGTHVTVCTDERGKVCIAPAFDTEVLDSDAAGGLRTWVRHNQVLQVDSTNYWVLIWIP